MQIFTHQSSGDVHSDEQWIWRRKNYKKKKNPKSMTRKMIMFLVFHFECVSYMTICLLFLCIKIHKQTFCSKWIRKKERELMAKLSFFVFFFLISINLWSSYSILQIQHKNDRCFCFCFFVAIFFFFCFFFYFSAVLFQFYTHDACKNLLKLRANIIRNHFRQFQYFFFFLFFAMKHFNDGHC